ncbi:DUF6268 family outer membrane beta-barrel protein [Planctomycetes bacterium K23_9]
MMRYFLSILSLLACAFCAAQESLPGLIEFSPGSLVQSVDESCDRVSDEIELSRFKKQALQSVSVSGGFLGDVGDGLLSSSNLELSVGTGIPLGSFDNIVGVTPGFRIDWIDADAGIDVPDELYQFEIQFFYRRPISKRLSAMAIVSPSIRSDLTTSDNAFRVFALGLLNWECIPGRLTLSGGVVYLGRADLPVVPAIGVLWKPDPDTKVDLRFPVATISRRIAKDIGRSEVWTYLAGGLGGNTWAVTRANSRADELSLRDFRLTAGIEKVVDGGGGWFAETGYAFGRRIEFERDDTELKLDDAVVLQAGWRY